MTKLDWVRDEFILALDVYLRDRTTAGNKTHPEVVALSELLNQLPIFRPEKRDEKFRNPDGVGMNIANFMKFDPSFHGKGLKRGSKLAEDVWNEYYLNQDKLRVTAAAIRNSYNLKEVVDYITEGTSDDSLEAPEGKILTALHRFRERSKKLVKTKKQKVLNELGRLDCEACGFNFESVYGVKGKEFIECHHDKPVSTLSDGDRTSIEDLRLICSNCHSIIHRHSPWLTVEELRQVIVSNV
jgi:5-methylcytosine-specific restriction protein A